VTSVAPTTLADARTTVLEWARHRPLETLARECVRVDLGVPAPDLAALARDRLLDLLPALESTDGDEAALLATRGWEMLGDPTRAFAQLERVAVDARGLWHLHRFARLAHLAGDPETGRELLDALVARVMPRGPGARTIAVADERVVPRTSSRWREAPRTDAGLHVHYAGTSRDVRVPIIADRVDADRLANAEVVGRYLFAIDAFGVAQTSGHQSDLPFDYEQDHGVLDTAAEVGRVVHVAAAGAHGLLAHIPHPRTRRIDRALLLGQNNADNYFHWMAECLPRLALLDAVDDGATMPLLVGAPLRPWQAETLRQVGVDPARVLVVAADESIAVDELWLVRSTLPHGALAESSARFLHDRLGAPRRSGAGRRLYLVRTEPLRNIVGEAEVLARYRTAGFEFVRPETLSFQEQVALFREASVVAGVVGASLTGLAFAPPATRVIASNVRLYLGPCYVALAHWLGHEMHALVGTEVPTAAPHPHWDYTLDPADVDRAIAAALD
jgi:capsular polysaccharide biosynthesis protein